jgi:hypothetical protein
MSSAPISPPTPDLAAQNPPLPTEDAARQGANPSAAPSAQRCRNCDAELHGRYCAHCGQDAHRNVLALWPALGEFLEEISQADARVWRTLRLLALRPGELTCEYLRGKRASYTPPLRLYVALSLLVFLVTLLPDKAEDKTEPIVSGTTAVSLTPAAQEALDEALAEDVDEKYRPVVREQLLKVIANVPADQQVRAVTDLAEECGASPLGVAVLNTGVAERLPPEKLLVNCKRVAKPAQKLFDEGTEFAPKLMVFFLPLIAVFGKLLYLGSRRYYIGHLVFFVHFHAFVFLATATGNLAGALASRSGLGWLDTLSDFLMVGLIFYVPIYLYKAMRRVYGQGRAVTRCKFLLLGFGYLISFALAAALLAGFVALQTDDAYDVDWNEVFNIEVG